VIIAVCTYLNLAALGEEGKRDEGNQCDNGPANVVTRHEGSNLSWDGAVERCTGMPSAFLCVVIPVPHGTSDNTECQAGQAQDSDGFENTDAPFVIARSLDVPSIVNGEDSGDDHLENADKGLRLRLWLYETEFVIRFVMGTAASFVSRHCDTYIRRK
jgi:hypothetical protein